MRAIAASLAVLQGLAGPAWAAPSRQAQIASFEAYRKVVRATAGMVSDQEAGGLASKHGLRVLDLTWEDSGRTKGSSVGPNISDMTIQVQELDPRDERVTLTLMPVIRYPNFEDKSADLSLDSFQLLVGNEKGGALRRSTLREYLGGLRKFLSRPESWKGKRASLLAKRDDKVLVSAQACFLPVPRSGKAEFNPVLFNYQSYEGDPAVLAVLATREGTSAAVIENRRDSQAGPMGGQRIFFNKNGQRAGLTGERLSDFRAAGGTGSASPGVNREQGLNMVLLVQVPLKQKRPRPVFGGGGMPESIAAVAAMQGSARSARSDVEEAVIGHGRVQGPFTEVNGLEIERDERFPIRVTVQFYKATSNGVVSAKDIQEIAAQIERVYKDASFVGSLVVSGFTGRPTEHGGL